MSFQRFFLILTLLITLSLGTTFFHGLGFPDSAWPLDKGERVTLSAGATLTQTFTSSRDHLRQIEILFGKFTLQGDDQLTLELRDSTCSTTLAETTLADRSFDSEHTYTFVFDPLEHSKDQTYCLALLFDSQRTIEKSKAPRLFTDQRAQAPSYILAEKDVITPGIFPLAIRPGYSNSSLINTLNELIDRISQYKPAFLKDGVVTAFAVFGLVFTFLVLLLLVHKDPASEENIAK